MIWVLKEGICIPLVTACFTETFYPKARSPSPSLTSLQPPSSTASSSQSPHLRLRSPSKQAPVECSIHPKTSSLLLSHYSSRSAQTPLRPLSPISPWHLIVKWPDLLVLKERYLKGYWSLSGDGRRRRQRLRLWRMKGRLRELGKLLSWSEWVLVGLRLRRASGHCGL